MRKSYGAHLLALQIAALSGLRSLDMSADNAGVPDR